MSGLRAGGSIAASASCWDAVRQLRRTRAGQLVVLDGDRLVGVLGVAELAPWLSPPGGSDGSRTPSRDRPPMVTEPFAATPEADHPDGERNLVHGTTPERANRRLNRRRGA